MKLNQRSLLLALDFENTGRDLASRDGTTQLVRTCAHNSSLGTEARAGTSKTVVKRTCFDNERGAREAVQVGVACM